LNEDQVRQAAAPLTDQGVRVAVYFVLHGGQADFITQLSREGLADGSEANSNVIAIYVSTSEQYSEIRWGANYDRQLEPVGRDLRSTRLNPGLREGDYTAAFVNTLEGIEQVLAGTYVSSGVSGSSSSRPAFDIDEIAPVVLIILLIGSWIYCLVTGKCKSSGSSSDNDRSFSSFSGGSSSSGGSSGGHDGGSWDD
jgi:hypothetical protein